MKRFFTILFTTMLVGQAWGQTSFTIGNLKYTILDATNHYVSVGKANNNITSNLTIESTIEKNGEIFTITRINSFAFCSGLTTVSIPNTVTCIDSWAFENCANLTSISIPNSVSSIGRYAFYNCGSLNCREFENGYYIGNDENPYTVLIDVNNNITSFTINNDCKFIYDNAFDGCNKLTEIDIYNTIISIGKDAFSNCSNLTSVIIPKSVKTIDDGAFGGCNKVIIYCETESKPDGWGSSWCTIDAYNYAKIIWNTKATISNDFVYEITSTAPYKATAIRYMGNNTSIEIPSTISSYGVDYSVTGIGESLFNGYTDLTSVSIPNSITYVGKDAFKSCDKIDFLLDGGCYYVGNEDNPYVMLLQVKDTSISSVTINSDCKIIYDEAFKDCRKLKSIVIPDSVTCIGSNAFSGCTSLASVDFNANNCISMGSSDYPVFAGCTSLSSVTFGDKVKIIPEYAFYGCAGLTSIAVPASVTNIGVGAFVNCNFKVMRSMGTTPATMTEDPFPTVDTVYVPSDKVTTYKKSTVWKRKEVFAVGNYNIKAASSNTDRGIVSGTGSYLVCENVELTATPAAHYRFDSWTDGNTDNPRVVTVKGDKTYTAQFVGEDCEITGSGTNGSVTGIGTQHYGDTVAITAVANTGYHFVKWSDGNTDNPRQIVVTQGLSFTPEFEISSFTITTYAENGTVIGGGTYTYGTQVTLAVTPDAGYRFTQWSDYVFNYSWGWSDGYYPTDNPRTITVTEDATYVPQFERERYTIFVDGSAVYWKEYYAYYGDTLYVQVGTSNGGYRFAGWADGSTDNPRMIVVTGNATYGVNFDNKYLFKFDSNGGDNVDSMIVSYGSYVNLPIPSRSGYTFIGWQYKGQDGETYTRNGEFEVYSDIEFIAVWEKANNTAVAESAANAINIYAHGNTIVVENATEEIRVYDAMGKFVCRDAIHRVRAEITVNTAGVYIVKTGGTVKRVMVK